MWVSWSPPEENGGSPVLQYYLEYKEQGSPWIDATVLKTNSTYMLISKNEKAYVYEVRVTAKNKFGLGAASKVVTAAFAGILLTHQLHVHLLVFVNRKKCEMLLLKGCTCSDNNDFGFCCCCCCCCCCLVLAV